MAGIPVSDAVTGPDDLKARRLRLSSRITGIIFWGAVLTGFIVVAVFIQQSHEDHRLRLDYRTNMLLRVVESTVAPLLVTNGLSDKATQLQSALEKFTNDDGLIGTEVQLGSEKILIGAVPKNAFIKTIVSPLIVDPATQKNMLVKVYFDNATTNFDTTRKNLIIFLGVISFAFGLTMNRILQKMLTVPIDKMIETAAAYAKGNKSARFDESKDDEFGFLSRFINLALNASETMHQQLETSVHEQRAAKERAEDALKELELAQDRLVQSEKLASLGQVTAGIAHEIKNPLNFVNNLSETSVELFSELDEAIEPYLKEIDADDRKNIAELLKLISTDLGTIAKHGKRADSIVKNMLMHSRKDGGERVSTDINALVSEALGLAYHGERATHREFQIEMDTRLADGLSNLMVVPQDISRVLINLLSNAFYATQKRKKNGQDEDYVPIVMTSTNAVEGGVEIRIRDNGTGISKSERQNLFTPFFTTKPTGEGTGLGLSISHDIITKGNKGRLEVDSEEGEFTEFVIWLPGLPDHIA